MHVLRRALGLLPTRWIKAASHLQWRHPLAKSAFEAVANRMRHKDGVILRGAGKGLHFNSGGSVAGFMLGTTEPGLQQAFLLFVKPKMAVFDVGANVGFYSVISARLVGREGQVVAFEPLAQSVRAIRHNVHLNHFNHVRVEPLALGKSDGDAEFNLSADPNWGMLASVGVPGSSVGRQIVRLARLDSLVGSGAVPPPDLMKIDVEGAEVDVLEGAAETLRTHRPILFIDLHGTNEPISRLLEDAAYEVRARPWREEAARHRRAVVGGDHRGASRARRAEGESRADGGVVARELILQGGNGGGFGLYDKYSKRLAQGRFQMPKLDSGADPPRARC